MSSASERLRALSSRLLRPWPSGQDPFLELGVALPLIADVVEAAEALDRDRQAFGYGKEQDIPGQLALAESLTALREHLEGQ